jgi:serine/threonine protein kinase
MRDMTMLIHLAESFGVIHNDIDHRNFIITPESGLVLIDFGNAVSSSATNDCLKSPPPVLMTRQHSRLYSSLVLFAGLRPVGDWIRKMIREDQGSQAWRAFLGELPYEVTEWLERKRLGVPDSELGPCPDPMADRPILKYSDWLKVRPIRMIANPLVG